MHGLSHPIGLDVRENTLDIIAHSREMDAIEREMAARAPPTGRDSTLIESYKKISP